MRRQIPLEDFFRKREITCVRLSPDGRFLGWLSPWKSRLNVFVKDLETGEIQRVTSEEGEDLWYFAWGNSERIVYLRDTGGDENSRIYGVRPDGTGEVCYTPFKGVRNRIEDLLECDDTGILISTNRRDRKLFDVFRLNLDTGELIQAAENPGNVSAWFADHDGRVRLAGAADGLRSLLLARDSEESPWRKVGEYDFRESADPLMFTPDNKGYYASSNVGRDRKVISLCDLETAEERDIIFSHPQVDVSTLLYSRKLAKPVGVRYTTEKLVVTWFDSKRQELQDFLDSRLPGRTNLLLSHDRQETMFVVFSSGDRSLGSYYLLNADSLELEHILDAGPWLKEEELAHMEPVSYTSRDGLSINAYLTVPSGVEPANLPVVIYPHGGPWSRDGWGFKPAVQFLANRGYAVFQMNFRGSTGYGRKFLEAGYGQWGLSMQDDITDGVQWLIEQGIADPKRIAIYGVSYGGYAVLMGIVKDPDLYAAAIDFVGVSNLFTILENMPPYWEYMREKMYTRIGHPERDRQRLIETSPALNTSKMKTPLFIAQGANDPRVNRTESDQVVEGLRNRGVPVTYMLKENEGHGFYKEENMFEFYRAAETFLAEHMGMED